MCIICPPAVMPVWRKELKLFPNIADKFTILSQGKFSRSKVSAEISFECLIIDEIHNFRALYKDSNRVKSVEDLADRCDYVIGLTGTLADKDNIELYNVIKILGG